MAVRSLIFGAGLTIIAPLVASSTSEAQSFNCNYAKKPVEVAICQDPNLSRLDEQMAQTYFDIVNALPGKRARQVKAEQSAFIRERNSCGYDFGCISASYNIRLRELCDWADLAGRPCYN